MICSSDPAVHPLSIYGTVPPFIDFLPPGKSNQLSAFSDRVALFLHAWRRQDTLRQHRRARPADAFHAWYWGVSRGLFSGANGRRQ